VKIWVAGIRGAWSSQQVTDALTRLGVESQIFPLSECCFDLSTGQVGWQEEDLSRLDGVLGRKLGDAADPLSHYRINMLHQLSHLGVKVLSSPAAIEEANNRYRMTLRLSRPGCPSPIPSLQSPRKRLSARWSGGVRPY
jgi:ribosomal protein S6--L-glutamate ligase